MSGVAFRDSQQPLLNLVDLFSFTYIQTKHMARSSSTGRRKVERGTSPC